MSTTKQILDNITPQEVIKQLKAGNERFVSQAPLKRNLSQETQDTKNGQHPIAIVLSCIDSRVPAEIIFDQGIGDIFSVRVAGNIVNEDILGSIEYACNVVGSKVIVVLGHSKCGAVAAAVDDVKLGNITTLLSKIRPVVEKVAKTNDSVDVETVCTQNIQNSITQIQEKSAILSDMATNKEISIVGAKYDVESGAVSFLSE